VIPGNDDAIRSIKLITNAIAEACIQGQSRRRDYNQSGQRDNRGPGPEVEFARSRQQQAAAAAAANAGRDREASDTPPAQE
jgi:small subunit ribosomal protein S2